jgi:hypothetical protein
LRFLIDDQIVQVLEGEWEFGAPCRNRTDDKSHARLSETSPASQIDSHGLVPPADLQEILKAWPSLAEPLKAAVLAIVRSTKGARHE